MAYSLKAIADDLLSVERSYTFTMIVKFTFYQMFLVFKDWFQCFSVSNLLLMLPLYRFCFQSTFLFPMSDVSFQFLYIFSKLKLRFQMAMFPNCFQIVSKLCMFPIYMEPYFRFGCFGFGWGLVMCIGVVKVCVNRSYYWKYCFWKFQLQKWRNSNDHQSVEQKVEVVDIEFLVCLLKPKIDHFSSFHPDTF